MAESSTGAGSPDAIEAVVSPVFGSFRKEVEKLVVFARWSDSQDFALIPSWGPEEIRRTRRNQTSVSVRLFDVHDSPR